MIVQQIEKAGDCQVYAQGCFDEQIGKPIAVTLNYSDLKGTLLAAEILDEGRQVLLTFELEDKPTRFLYWSVIEPKKRAPAIPSKERKRKGWKKS